MRLLAFEAAGPGASVALGDVAGDGSLRILGAHRDDRRGAGDRLLAEAARLLEDAGADILGLAALVVDRGPGSFTGVRTAVAAARGLALASARPVVAVTRFDLLASAVEPHPGETLVVLLRAGRDQVSAQAFTDRRRPLGAPRLGDARAVLSGLPRPLLVATLEGTVEIDQAPADRRCAVRSAEVDARTLLRLASARMLGGLAPIPGSELEPLYSRPPDAVPPRRLIERPDDAPPAHARPQAP